MKKNMESERRGKKAECPERNNRWDGDNGK